MAELGQKPGPAPPCPRLLLFSLVPQGFQTLPRLHLGPAPPGSPLKCNARKTLCLMHQTLPGQVGLCWVTNDFHVSVACGHTAWSLLIKMQLSSMPSSLCNLGRLGGFLLEHYACFGGRKRDIENTLKCLPQSGMGNCYSHFIGQSLAYGELEVNKIGMHDPPIERRE